MAEIIRNEFNKPVGVVLFEGKYATAIYAIPEDRTYYQFTGNDLTHKQAQAALRELQRAIKC